MTQKISHMQKKYTFVQPPKMTEEAMFNLWTRHSHQNRIRLLTVLTGINLNTEWKFRKERNLIRM